MFIKMLKVVNSLSLVDSELRLPNFLRNLERIFLQILKEFRIKLSNLFAFMNVFGGLLILFIT